MASLISTKVMDKLSNVGLNSYERKLYVTLLGKGVSAAGALSELSTVPRSRCYDVLESLREKGFVVVQNTKPIKYVAVKPSDALDKLKNVYENQYKESVDRIDDMKGSDTLKELDDMFSKAVDGVSSAEMNGSIKGKHQASQHIESAIKRSNTSISFLASESGLIDLLEHSKHLKAANERGVAIRIAAPVTSDSREHAKMLSQFADVRHADNDSRMMIVDGNEVLMALTSDDTHPNEDMHFWTQSNHVSSSIASPMFENMWNTAKKI